MEEGEVGGRHGGRHRGGQEQKRRVKVERGGL